MSTNTKLNKTNKQKLFLIGTDILEIIILLESHRISCRKLTSLLIPCLNPLIFPTLPVSFAHGCSTKKGGITARTSAQEFELDTLITLLKKEKVSSTLNVLSNSVYAVKLLPEITTGKTNWWHWSFHYVHLFAAIASTACLPLIW